MFLSRTVAAEICMEAKTNEIAYAALKKLGQSGDLLFELPYVSILCHRESLPKALIYSALVEDLIKVGTFFDIHSALLDNSHRLAFP